MPNSHLPISHIGFNTYSKRILSPRILLLVLAKYNSHHISSDEREALQDLKVYTESIFTKNSFNIKFMLIILVKNR